jgi:hypothetical protein
MRNKELEVFGPDVHCEAHLEKIEPFQIRGASPAVRAETSPASALSSSE